MARVVVCNRRGTAKQGNKCDRVDAGELADLLRAGRLRAVYHGRSDRLALKELTRTYENLVEDAVGAMLRVKALFRARVIRTAGKQVYEPQSRGSWLDRPPDRGCRFRAEALAAKLDVLRELRRKVKPAMLAEARKDPAYELLRTMPLFGPVRVAQLLVTMQTPWHFRTKRNLSTIGRAIGDVDLNHQVRNRLAVMVHER